MTARPIRYQRQVSDRKGKIFYTSITSLSHISKLRREEVTVEYKAILTPVNRTWTLRHLYLEMQREKAAISRKS